MTKPSRDFSYSLWTITPVLTKRELISLTDCLARMETSYRKTLEATTEVSRENINIMMRDIRSVRRKSLFAIVGDTQARKA